VAGQNAANFESAAFASSPSRLSLNLHQVLRITRSTNSVLVTCQLTAK
jgi:hypothetical protein